MVQYLIVHFCFKIVSYICFAYLSRNVMVKMLSHMQESRKAPMTGLDKVRKKCFPKGLCASYKQISLETT